LKDDPLEGRLFLFYRLQYSFPIPPSLINPGLYGIIRKPCLVSVVKLVFLMVG
jgi:hypothetical protein